MAVYDHVEWPAFLDSFAWRQGEHVAVVSPTGGGKTTLVSRIIGRRSFVVLLATKRHDPVLSTQFPGFKMVRDWPVPSHVNRAVLWPRGGKTTEEFKARQRAVFARAMDGMFFERGWTVVVDECHYVCDAQSGLGIPGPIMLMQHQGRSSGITNVNGMQRPSWVPPVIFSGSTHAFLWKTTHPDDLKRLGNLGGINARELAANLATLGRHDFLYVNTRSGADPVRSRVNMRGGGG